MTGSPRYPAGPRLASCPRISAEQPSTRADIQAYRHARVLLLGGSGFIGRWVARALTEAGATLVVVVRSRGAASQVLERWGVKADVIQADLERDESLADVCRATQPSITFNLAGYGVDPSERDEEAAQAINARLVGRLAQVLGETGDPRWQGRHLIHAGSALEYGDVTGPLTEETRPNPTTVYGRSKLRGTEMLAEACRHSGLRGITARLFMVYGAGEHESRLLPQLIRAASAVGDVHLTSGAQRRDFTYVEDAAEGLLRLGLVREQPAGAVVNLATGHLTRVKDVIETAAAQLGIDLERLRFGSLPTRQDEMTGLTGVSVWRLRSLTGWCPETTVEEGIKRTLRRQRELAAKGITFAAGEQYPR